MPSCKPAAGFKWGTPASSLRLVDPADAVPCPKLAHCALVVARHLLTKPERHTAHDAACNPSADAGSQTGHLLELMHCIRAAVAGLTEVRGLFICSLVQGLH